MQMVPGSFTSYGEHYRKIWAITEKLNRNLMTDNAKEPHQKFIAWALLWNEAQKTALPACQLPLPGSV